MMHKLNALAVKSLPAGKHEDGAGLRLVKREDGSGQWVFRYTCHGRRREMGLGSIMTVSLKQAREKAAEYRAMIANEVDPINARERLRAARRHDQNLLMAVARDAFESHKASLKRDGAAGRWFSPLELHVLPKLGKTPIAELTQRDIRDALQPIWHEKASTAMKAMDRLSIVFRHAAALGIDVDLQAVAKAKALLGKQRHRAEAIPSMPWTEVPHFYLSLAEPSVSHLALRLLILTGMRSHPVRFAHVDEFEGDTWIIPAEKMKGPAGATESFRVPLSQAAQEVIHHARRHARGGYLFVARKSVISDATMSRLMERRGLQARPHGFRSSLRTWLAECTDAPHEVAETMLAHVNGSKVVRAYRRTDYLEQRRTLLERWAAHCVARSLTPAGAD